MYLIKNKFYKIIDTKLNNMRVGILTFHCAHNYGAVLQCYALQETLKQMGHDVEVIDYRPQYLLTPYNIFNKHRILSKNPILVIKHCIREMFILAVRLRRYNAFNKFIVDRLNLSHPIIKHDIPDSYDAYIMGSDQIWNYKITKGFDPTYFGYFDFQKGKKKYISYAASMETKLLDDRSTNFYLDALNNFDALSVRETRLAELLQPLTTKKIETVLDPTLLADRGIWNRIALQPSIKRKYVLVYQVRYNKNTLRIAHNIANQIDAIVIEITAYPTTHFNKNSLQVSSPEEFLGLVKHAACVVTTSFHGTAFSIIFNRPFYCIQLEDEGDTRAQSLLKSINLCDRMIKSNESPKFTKIDYNDEINKRIFQLRENSLNYLKNNIK